MPHSLMPGGNLLLIRLPAPPLTHGKEKGPNPPLTICCYAYTWFTYDVGWR